LLRFLVYPFAKDHLEDAISRFSKRAKDECHEMGINSDWRKRWGSKGEIYSRDVDSRRRPRSLLHFEGLNEHG
jgi:hypothetical protein